MVNCFGGVREQRNKQNHCVVKYRHMIGTKGVSYLYIGPLFNYVCSFVCVFYMCNYSIIFS